MNFTPTGDIRDERQLDASVAAAFRRTGPKPGSVIDGVAGRHYPRGGGESGVRDDSSGSGLNGVSESSAASCAIIDNDGPSTAAGPIKNAVIAATGSEVLRQEQG